MRILIISTNAIGDTYLSLSAIEPLKRQFGIDCFIDVITNPDSEVLAKTVGVENVYIVKNKSFKSLLSTIRECRKNYYNYVFSFFPGRINSLFLFLTAAKYRSGFWNILSVEQWWYNTKESGFSNYKSLKIFHWNSSQSYYERLRICLSNAGIYCTEIRKPLFTFSVIKQSDVKKYIVIHGQSSQRDRSLSSQTILALARLLYLTHKCEIHIILWGDETTFSNYRNSIWNDFQLFYNLPLEETVRQIIYATLFVAIESFPLHIADAYNTNFIGIFGPTDPARSMQHPGKSIQFATSDLYNLNSDIILESLKNIR